MQSTKSGQIDLVKRKSKNSNVIKKVGKILIDHADELMGGVQNPGFVQMNRRLIEKAGKSDKRDKFDTNILKMMFEGLDSET